MPAPSPADVLAAAAIHCEPSEDTLGSVVRLEASRVSDAVAALYAAGYRFLVDLFGTDDGERIELTYHIRDLAEHADVYLKVFVGYEGEAPSVWRIFPAALYPEREAAELLGVSFPGHPNPKRLLTSEGVGPLLRRSVLVRTAEEVQRPVE